MPHKQPFHKRNALPRHQGVRPPVRLIAPSTAFSPPSAPNHPIAVECDSASSLITEVEVGRGIALATPVFQLVAGKRLLYRPLTGTTEVLSAPA